MKARWAVKARADLDTYGITQRELAAELGISYQYLSAVFNGKKPDKPIKERIVGTIKKLIERKKGLD